MPSPSGSERSSARRPAALLAALLLLVAAGTGIAADPTRSLSADGYTVHFNALPTTALSAEVARSYGITRSGTRGFLNIAVLRDDDGGTAVPASITARSRALTGQVGNIELRELRDQDAIYYVGEFRIRGEEQLRFELEVRPEGATRSIPVRFEHRFVGE
ncbi:MAG: DUF4426 domain-containing protein [Xanthomonadales bacterium]|nr:DUF4426 domain-containing protein [Xanthomonadales bacterium]